MESVIPINGRIAIVDDKIDQALPLMRVLSKNNIPYSFYKGDDCDCLPLKPENDIRILFLDINLQEGRVQKKKDIRSALVPRLKRLLSPDNYPYILILWSRQEREYTGVIEEIFEKDLKDRAPIAIESYVKSVFFPNFGDEEDESADEMQIIEKLKEILDKHPAYKHLIQWENCIHDSADATIGDIFKDYHSHENWNENANCILNMMAKSYLEQAYGTSTPETKIKASLSLLNNVLFDCLENVINKYNFECAGELTHNISEDRKKEIVSKINHSLLVSNVIENITMPGSVFRYYLSNKYKIHFEAILSDSCNCDDEKKTAMKETMIPCEIVVNPSCDYAQKKLKTTRIVQGLLIESKHIINGKKIKNIDHKTDAIYCSPSFEYKGRNYVMVLNFRYFVTDDMLENKKRYPLFRVRNSMLAEIQSKLARHINRQGIINL